MATRLCQPLFSGTCHVVQMIRKDEHNEEGWKTHSYERIHLGFDQMPVLREFRKPLCIGIILNKSFNPLLYRHTMVIHFIKTHRHTY